VLSRLPSFFRNSDHIWRAALLAGCDWLEHGFGTRRTVWDAAGRLASAKQVHSSRCLYAATAGRIGEADALITDQPGLLLAVRTADCLPIFVADPEHRAVAAIHAGWRGIVAGILAEVLGRMAERFGSRPDALLVALGPAIGACCYEVGPEVAARFRELFPEREDLNGRARLDLAEAARRQLLEAGVRQEQLALAGLCTRCLADEFYSWRRDGPRTGRMLSVIGIRG
jgi:YfiH family protein